MQRLLIAVLAIDIIYLFAVHSVCIPSTTFIQLLSNSSISDILNITFNSSDPTLNLISCDQLAVSSKWTGGKLILSDSPEYPNDTGKLYEHHNLPATSNSSLSSASNRIFMYHVNGKVEGNLRFSVLIQNNDNFTSAELEVMKSGVAGPSSNYLYTGKVAAERWMKSAHSNRNRNAIPIVIPPRGTVELDPTFSSFSVPPGQLLHGIWDYSVNTSHNVILCSLDDSKNEDEDLMDLCISSQLFQRDSHIRGTFENAEKVLQYPNMTDSFQNLHAVLEESSRVILQFPIADGLDDEFISGVDATDGSVQRNSGNYGVLYRIPVTVNTSYLVNPRGGPWTGVVEVSGQVSLLPEGTSSIRDNTQGVVIKGFLDDESDSYSEDIIYMPVGGSNLPIRIALIA